MDRRIPYPYPRSFHCCSSPHQQFFFDSPPPNQLHSKQGRQFESELLAEVCKLLGIAKSRTTPYHPQSDGLIQQFNCTLLNMLATAATNYPFEWQNHLRHLCMTPGCVSMCLMDNHVQTKSPLLPSLQLPLEIVWKVPTGPFERGYKSRRAFAHPHRS